MTDIISMVPRRRVLAFASLATLTASWGQSLLAAAAPLKIATIGAGRMGGALGTAFAKAGHQVMFSSRKPEELKDLVTAAGPNARAGTVQEAAAFGDVVVLVVPYGAMPEVARDVGKVLATKALVFDVSNPQPQRDGDIGVKALEQGPGEYLMQLMPGVRIVRGFNSTNWNSIPKPTRPDGGKLGVAIAGDDPKGLEIAQGLAREIGFDPVVVGPLSVGKYLYRPSTFFNGSQSADEIRQIAPQLKK